ncbi:SMI1/KNR4 family protein [Kribbella antiqua]|uniref:SMI1/KNR4 family protein n=1 Tax=Kribbella antiqua TaxID=2512217 RepID=UPI00105231E4|nr:SMI1/KNR4 family protein [Kribbella antiqua]
MERVLAEPGPCQGRHVTITESWAWIDRWLSQHAPTTYAVLAPPATDAELSAAQQVVEFPPELIESLRCHNGLTTWANLLPEAQPSSCAEIAANWQLRMDLAEEYDSFAAGYWHPTWIPWADSDGDLQVIDLHRARLGMAYHDGTGDFTNAYPSLASYLESVVESLHTGTGINNWYPYLTPHHELWWDQGPDRQFVNNEPLVRVPTSAQ